jgi:hypothetical protein
MRYVRNTHTIQWFGNELPDDVSISFNQGEIMACTFNVRGIAAKRPTGHAYQVMATDRGITFTCLTTDNNGSRPSRSDSDKYDFQLAWEEIIEVKKPATMLDRLVVFVLASGKKIECIFEKYGQEVLVFKRLESLYGTKPATFTYEPTPQWMLIVLPAAFSIGMIAAGIALFWLFSHLEEDGGRARMNLLIWLLYFVGGKYGLLAISFLLAAGGVGWAVLRLRKHDALEQPTKQ